MFIKFLNYFKYNKVSIFSWIKVKIIFTLNIIKLLSIINININF